MGLAFLWCCPEVECQTAMIYGETTAMMTWLIAGTLASIWLERGATAQWKHWKNGQTEILMFGKWCKSDAGQGKY